jgi:hypothetical protein
MMKHVLRVIVNSSHGQDELIDRVAQAIEDGGFPDVYVEPDITVPEQETR